MSQHYYFGKWSSMHGHVLYQESGQQVWTSMPADFPFREETCDTGFLPPKRPQVEGRASLIHFNTEAAPAMRWTVLTFWDRSGDKRGNSSSTFILRGHYTFEEACALAKEKFPELWQRFTFTVRLDEGVD